jgi:hypothetical protein
MKSLNYYSSDRHDSEALRQLGQMSGEYLEALELSELVWIVGASIARYQRKRLLKSQPMDGDKDLMICLLDLTPDGLLSVAQTAIDQLKSDRTE